MERRGRCVAIEVGAGQREVEWADIAIMGDLGAADALDPDLAASIQSMRSIPAYRTTKCHFRSPYLSREY